MRLEKHPKPKVQEAVLSIRDRYDILMDAQTYSILRDAFVSLDTCLNKLG
jgi:hypothetical protein